MLDRSFILRYIDSNNWERINIAIRTLNYSFSCFFLRKKNPPVETKTNAEITTMINVELLLSNTSGRTELDPFTETPPF